MTLDNRKNHELFLEVGLLLDEWNDLKERGELEKAEVIGKRIEEISKPLWKDRKRSQKGTFNLARLEKYCIFYGTDTKRIAKAFDVNAGTIRRWRREYHLTEKDLAIKGMIW